MGKPGLKLDFKKAGLVIGAAIGILTLVIGKAGPGLALLFGIMAALLEIRFGFRRNKNFNPYYLLILSPLTLIHYSTIADFQIRMVCFFTLVYIFNIVHTPGAKKPILKFPHPKPLLIWLVAFLIFSASATILYLQGIHLSGDEPHYIMVAQSIVEDGDFNLENNLKNKTYYKYLPVDIPLHGKIHNRKYVSYHMPGVSFLVVPFYAIFNLLKSLVPGQLYFRLVASLISAFFALGLYTVLRIQFPGKNISPIWIFFLCSYPLIFHSVHLYPELPAAGLTMGAFIFSSGEKKNYWLSGLFLSLVAWFHVKYYPSVIVLAIIIIWPLIKNKKWKSLSLFSIFPVINCYLIMMYSKILYGALSPTVIFPGENYFLAPVLLRIKVLLAYFFDQRDGLLFYSPVLFLLFFGFKNRLKNQRTLLWISIPYVLFHAFTTVRGAYSPAGRPLIFISWILLLLVANFYFQKKPGEDQPGFKILTGFSIFALIWLFYYPLFIYQPVFAQTVQRASSWLLFLGSSTVNLWKLFPSFLTPPGNSHPASWIWIVLSIILVGFYYSRRRKSNPFKKYREFIFSILFILFSCLFCLHPHVHLFPQNRFTDGKISFFNSSKNFRYIQDQRGFNILAGETYTIFLESQTDQKALTFIFRNTGKIQVKIHNKTRLLFQSRGQGIEKFSLQLPVLKTIKIKRKTVIPLEITTRTREKQIFLFLQIT